MKKIIKKIEKFIREDKTISGGIRTWNLRGYQTILFIPEDDYIIPNELYPSIEEGIVVLSDSEVNKFSKNFDETYKLVIIPGWSNDPENDENYIKSTQEFIKKIKKRF